ncbi:ABC transporter ATP-binding protein [Mycoplasmopsis cynos]|uniref:ABC transporter ATP-binding protein n=4 Tax=Mycoplasmopsis cynos TaxID=171284 RepID=A0ABD8AHZ6_9BACT|nr:ABC transporter ATP-binding protein [Mycoplasmopsis cynos]WQQ12796.1 ABC transporter ATP-binding protein [Mycoplasmopsis cynos]WQQ14005.1 ABC transporter ATP-binding protein [Mycoplasmopsis cynos]WQQ14932.1 ABC transporter ATP-binding protein [Mycoplasmopsis cynos]WQQ15879.1 ABC transporter ATP-binding protein [Mycoplasmopsis cynos]WQQ19052.1 ABC transporter ATP-binding protein [Mycoplasmopsis cynos]
MKNKNNSIIVFKRIFSYLWRNNKFTVIFGVLLFLLASGGMLYNQVFIGKIIVDYVLKDFLISRSIKDFDYNYFYLVIVLSALWFLISILFKFFGNFLLSSATFKTMKIIQDELYYKIQNLPMSYLNKELKGTIISTFNSDIETLKNFFRDVIPNIINAILSLSVSIVIMFVLDVYLTFIILIFIILIFITSFLISKKSKKVFSEERNQNAKWTGFLEENLSGFNTNIIFNKKTHLIKLHNKLTNDYQKKSQKAYIISGVFYPFAFNIGLLGYGIVTIFGAILIIKGNSAGIGLTIGTLISFTQFAKSFSFPIASIMINANDVFRAIAGTKRIFNILDQDLEKNQGSYYLYVDSKGIKYWKSDLYKHQIQIKGEISFENVYFKYDDQYILKNINFKIKPGQKIALVGSTGAGKTTIINLIGGFYEIEKGNIYLDGINLTQINKQSLRQVIGYVLQETQLFSDTIKNNITYGSINVEHNVDESDVENAVKSANFDRHLEKMSAGVETFLSNAGNSLSQGQKQLLSIARINYKNPKIIIMDEATSNVDTLTEKEIQKSMNKLTLNTTAIIIAHRLSTIKECDNIYVIENGEIIEQGNHNQLIKTKGRYYSLLKKQNSDLNQID